MGARSMLQFNINEPTVVVQADEKTLMQVFSLPPLEAKLLQAMLIKSWVGSDELPAIKYSIRQVVFKLRAKLRQWPVTIINDGEGRYALAPHGRETIRRVIEEALVTP